jgi:hypothetical protein
MWYRVGADLVVVLHLLFIVSSWVASFSPGDGP